MSDEPCYRGYRLSDLLIIEIGWSAWSIGHLRSRTQRYPDDADELDIEPEWATEAALDEFGLLSLTKESDLRVTGWTANAPPASWGQRPGRVLRVILKPNEIDEGSWNGVTAAPASRKAAEWYWRQRRSFGAP